MSNFNELRQEFVKPSFRDKMKSELGETCVNCGSVEHIDYHHIVPLENGGTNKLSNIVPLCVNCHLAAHDKTSHNNKIAEARAKGLVGRKHKKTYEECLPYIEAFYKLEMGTKECKEKCGYSKNVKLSQTAYFKKYRKEHDIPEYFYNNIDLLASKEKRLKAMMKK